MNWVRVLLCCLDIPACVGGGLSLTHLSRVVPLEALVRVGVFYGSPASLSWAVPRTPFWVSAPPSVV